MVVPRPSQAGQAPNGLLKENSRGSISSMVKPDTGQANLAEKVWRVPPSASSANSRPSDTPRAVSLESAWRVIARAHVLTPFTHAHLVCLLLLFLTFPSLLPLFSFFSFFSLFFFSSFFFFFFLFF